MATAMSRLNVTIFDGDNQLTHWRGSPSSSGGGLKMVNTSPVGGPPQADWDTAGDDREPYEFDVETDILGATIIEQRAFIARYATGKHFPSDSITGLPEGVNFVVQEANVTHSDGEDASRLKIKLREVGSLQGGVPVPNP